MTTSSVSIIRPTPILRYYSEMGLSSAFSCPVPDGQIGSTNMLERLMLVIFSRLTNANKIFEFGTYRGETTQLFIENRCCNKLVTLDMPYLDDSKRENTDDYDLSVDWQNDKFLTSARSSQVDQRIIAKASEHCVEVELLKCDSLEFDNTPYVDDIDLIFVDGGHTMELVKSDSENAFELLSKNGILFWHDYGSSIHTEVTEFIDNLSAVRDIHAIGDTGLAFYTENTKIKNGISF